MNNNFNHAEFYSTYPSKVISRPGYPTRAAYKSQLIFKTFEKQLFKHAKTIKSYADIGGCFGFGANAMSFFIGQKQGFRPETSLFEIEKEFVKTGKTLFPDIKFEETRVEEWKGDEDRYDLFTLFDVIEHVMEPELFLQNLSKRCKYLLLKTPMETSGEWFGSIQPPLEEQGENHEDGHVNFFSPKSYETLLQNNNFEIIDAKLISSIIPKGTDEILNPEFSVMSRWTKLKLARYPKLFAKQILKDLPLIPWTFKRKILGGGEHICLCKSKMM